LLDNGRTRVLADEHGRSALHCIRCSACLNVCPVYERVGGHAYGSVYPGPIGAILSPQLTGLDGRDTNPNDTLPYASSLCGACYDVCPVKIPIPDQLVRLRAEHIEAHSDSAHLPTPEGAAMRAAAWIMSDAGRFARAGRAALKARRGIRRGKPIIPLPPPLNRWTASRDVPDLPDETFRDWWARTHPQDVNAGPGEHE
jgi:L-lactate dehydrogenase complex protein LldF